MSDTFKQGSKQVEDLPIDGVEGRAAREYVDPTEDEREETGIYDTCGQVHPSGERGHCTRPKGHAGMHLAGAGDYLVGAW